MTSSLGTVHFRQGRVPTAFLLALVLALLTATACSKQGSLAKQEAGAAAERAPTLLEQGVKKMNEAGSDIRLLKETDDWVAEQLKAKGATPEGQALASWRPKLLAKLTDSFRELAHKQASQGTADGLRKLLDWSAKVMMSEEARPEAERSELATSLRAPIYEMKKALLALDPQNSDLRKEMGYEELQVDPDALAASPAIDDDELLKDIDALKAQLDSAAEKTADGKRWLVPGSPQIAQVAAIVARADAMKADYDERMRDQFQRDAWEVGQRTADDMTKALKNVSYKWTWRAFKPYVLIVERDESWREADVAKDKASQLNAVYRSFFDNYKDVLGLEPLEKPVPVVMFKRENAYLVYAKSLGLGVNTLGHFEHATGRLVLSDGTEQDTLMHEGTHQIIAFNTKAAAGFDFFRRSYWFEEGIAEYFAGSHREIDPTTKEWHYEIGDIVLAERLNFWRQNEQKAYKLYDFLNLTMRDRQKNQQSGDEDLNLFAYSQGWFLIYFLNNYFIDAEGFVVIGHEGKYKKQWLRFFKGALEGKASRDDFLQEFGLTGADGKVDQKKFAAFEAEFRAYFEFVNKKLAMKYHVKDRKLVPWDQVVKPLNGKKIGDKEDDRLIKDAK
jgi:hypothetical protein